MADDLTRPYIGYRSAGRRPERQQDRRASADAPLAALRGMISGVAGAPGDIESLVRMLPGLSEQTVLPTSEDIERRLPLRSVSETPAGRAFTTIGQIGGGGYMGPGSPLRAIAAMPSSVSRAGRDFAMAAGQPAVNVVKPKGGNWLAGSVERAIEPMRTVDPAMMDVLRNADPRFVDQAALNRVNAEGMALDKWLETKLTKYIRNEMATPEDPIRALAERGVLHMEPYAIPQNPPLRLEINRKSQGFPAEGFGQSDAARFWEQMSDMAIRKHEAGDLTQRGIGGSGVEKYLEENPWLLKVPPETAVYNPFSGVVQRELGFSHLADELRNAINPASGLPENLRWKYQDLDKVTVPQAVQRVADINAWRAAQKAEADLMRAQNAATFTHKEYPEAGFRWVEIRQPEAEKITQLPEGWRVLEDSNAGQKYHYVVNEHGGTIPGSGFIGKTPEEAIANTLKGLNAKRETQALEDALKYEGETMGHCVGGYCPDVLEGRSRIYSLRDKKGQPHVTIEVRPGAFSSPEEALRYEQAPENGLPSIVQIKGKANRAPNPEYLPAVQDFVRSGNWSKVGDLQNTGLISYKGEYRLPEEFLYRTDEGGWEPLVDVAKRAFPDSPAKQLNFYRGASELENDIKLKPQDEGFAEGGLVGSNIYNSDAMQNPREAYRFADGGHAGDSYSYAGGGLVGGANFPTYDFDPARIDSIVGELHAMNAG